jgi:23S rRNA (guanosine2251-2'-O)-methyltransferase
LNEGKRNQQLEKISRLNPLLEIIRSSPGRVDKLLIQEGIKKPKVDQIFREAKKQGLSVSFMPKKRLDRWDRHHQGAIAFVTAKGYTTVDSILDSSNVPFLVLLDGIEDPQNLGAIIRTAEGAGVDGIILPERRAAGLTGTVASVSAGASEHVKVARVKNIARTMEDLKKRDIWLVGAEGGQSNLWHEFDYTLPVGLVFGSEGRGIRPLVREKCDKILSLPLLGNMTSLNVGAAAAIFIYEVVRQRMKDSNE